MSVGYNLEQNLGAPHSSGLQLFLDVYSRDSVHGFERVATVTPNRPDKLNAWTRSMEQEVRQAMQEAARRRRPRHRATGAGADFAPAPT